MFVWSIGLDEIVNRDVKSSNVLLDVELDGRLGDFGLARLCDHGANLESTKVAGTVGFLAPELTRTGRATTSLMCLLLELSCWR